MDDLIELIKKAPNKSKGIFLIGAGVLICLGGFLMVDFWRPNADLLFNIKNSYITIFQDPRPFPELSGHRNRTVRLPFSLVFFVSSALVVVGSGFLLAGNEKKQ